MAREDPEVRRTAVEVELERLGRGAQGDGGDICDIKLGVDGHGRGAARRALDFFGLSQRIRVGHGLQEIFGHWDTILQIRPVHSPSAVETVPGTADLLEASSAATQCWALSILDPGRSDSRRESRGEPKQPEGGSEHEVCGGHHAVCVETNRGEKGYFRERPTEVQRYLAQLLGGIRWENESQEICCPEASALPVEGLSIRADLSIYYSRTLVLCPPLPTGGPLSTDMATLDRRSTSSGPRCQSSIYGAMRAERGPLVPGAPWKDQARIGSPQTLTRWTHGGVTRTRDVHGMLTAAVSPPVKVAISTPSPLPAARSGNDPSAAPYLALMLRPNMRGSISVST